MSFALRGYAHKKVSLYEQQENTEGMGEIRLELSSLTHYPSSE